MNQNFIYLDNAATTPVRKEVLDAMLHFFSESYYNPSSIYNEANNIKINISLAREKIAKAINVKPSEIYFTSGGSESISWAIKSSCEIACNFKQKGHIITTAVEHQATLSTCEYMQRLGYDVSFLEVDKYGMISAAQVLNSIKDDTIFISIIYANNEIGTIMPVVQIGNELKKVNTERIKNNKNRIIFHIDGVAAVGHIDVDVASLGVDLLSMSAHKFYGPKGVGALFCNSQAMPALIYGGSQERGRRGGTENVPGIVGMGYALSLALDEMEFEVKRQAKLRDEFIDDILNNIPNTSLNGHPTKRLSNNINISFEGVSNEDLLLLLDTKGIKVSAGSACTSGSLEVSHVLLALGLSPAAAKGALRITLGKDTKKEDMNTLLKELVVMVDRLKCRDC